MWLSSSSHERISPQSLLHSKQRKNIWCNFISPAVQFRSRRDHASSIKRLPGFPNSPLPHHHHFNTDFFPSEPLKCLTYPLSLFVCYSLPLSMPPWWTIYSSSPHKTSRRRCLLRLGRRPHRSKINFAADTCGTSAHGNRFGVACATRGVASLSSITRPATPASPRRRTSRTCRQFSRRSPSRRDQLRCSNSLRIWHCGSLDWKVAVEEPKVMELFHLKLDWKCFQFCRLSLIWNLHYSSLFSTSWLFTFTLQWTNKVHYRWRAFRNPELYKKRTSFYSPPYVGHSFISFPRWHIHQML